MCFKCPRLVEPRSDGQLPSLPFKLRGDLSLLPAGPEVSDEGSCHIYPDDDDGDLDGNHEGGGSEERQPRWHLELRLLQHRSRPLHVHLQRVAGDQVSK